MLYKVEQCDDLTSVPIGRGPISVNHLFFTDDSLLFCEANMMELTRVLNILELYEQTSVKY